jgi:hypothetical protein
MELPKRQAEFDPVEYAKRNYGHIMAEDRTIIHHMAHHIRRMPMRRAERVADVGTGPNLYPAMLMSALVADEGSIDLIEPGEPSLQFLETLLYTQTGIYYGRDSDGREQSIDTRALWPKFSNLITITGRHVAFTNTYLRTRLLADCIPGDIFELPEKHYDHASSFFVAETITDDEAECALAIRSLVSCVRPGGTFFVGMMVGNEDWPADEIVRFPVARLTMPDVRQMFDDIPEAYRTDIRFISGPTNRTRSGYSGMALAIGTRTP